jgi:hypothetical protein
MQEIETWNSGIMEHWNNGYKQKPEAFGLRRFPNLPAFHYSIIPVFLGGIA